MNIVLPINDFSPKSLLLSDIPISDAYLNNHVYRACSDCYDYPDYPIRKGDFIVMAYNGVIIIGCDSLITIDCYTLSQESFNVPVELTNHSASIEIK
ncbi:hypothetical protein JLBYU43_3 [Escherichia phage JLBYU43]|uniref:Uncharacterized protein n=1 Tax=Escherichia phage JLBYU43 TaxID=2894751 RepID=A0AAE8YY33_9CAUD|nr:hypothetical protein JLBYU43_3 [Escherichia phage JLBYU43]